MHKNARLPPCGRERICPAGRERRTVGSLGGEERNVTRQRVRSSSEGVFLCENYAYVAATPRSGIACLRKWMYVHLSRSFGVLDLGQGRDARCPGRGNGLAAAYDAAWGPFSLQLYRSDAMAPGTHAWCQVAVATNVLFDKSSVAIFIGKPIPGPHRYLSRSNGDLGHPIVGQ